eukprot:m.52335 g.52335  ORF g.52335 m.52335 type:complete len:258 (-) comp7618_c0_seq2:753-1526(-)
MLTLSALLSSSVRRLAASTTTTLEKTIITTSPHTQKLSTASHCEKNELSSSKLKRAKVYTRTGDKGTSSLFTGERRTKTDPIFEALGTIDELSSFLGVTITRVSETPSCSFMRAQLIEIQCMLQDVASYVATPSSSASTAQAASTRLPENYVTKLELWIDELDRDLKPLSNFILPGGGSLSSSIHCARSICRRAERRVVDVMNTLKGQDMENEMDHVAFDPIALQTLNRLSDYLFTLARSAAMHTNEEEIIYKSPKK